MVLQSIDYSKGHLRILNQTKLPHVQEYEDVGNAEDAWHAIKQMHVRGAPAIAIVAVLSLAVQLENNNSSTASQSAEETLKFIEEKLDYLVTSRPTAVNLADAAKRLKAKVQESTSKPNASSLDVSQKYIECAEMMLEDDISTNEKIGAYGSKLILSQQDGADDKPICILTHCNTGSLATAGYGTALGVIRSIHQAGRLRRAYFTETRPYNQGSRLTAFELIQDKIPATLVTDSMASSLLQLKRDSENIVAVVVGADRVAANGDTANKIGTYSLAIAAKHHGVKFFVAAPRTTIDLQTKSGQDIQIEERPQDEVTTISGPVVKDGLQQLDSLERISIAAPGIDVWNPGFDVTPAEMIDGIITEVGVLEKDGSGQFHPERLFEG